MIEVKLIKKAKEDCLRGGFPVDYLIAAIQEEMEGKTMTPLINDIIGISVVYEKTPIIAFGRQFEDLLLIDEVSFNVVVLHAPEDSNPVVHRSEYIESEQYKSLKSIGNKNELLLTPIEYLDLSVRTHKKLWDEGIRTIGDIISNSEEYYNENQNFPYRCIDEIKSRLGGLNLEFGKGS